MLFLFCIQHYLFFHDNPTFFYIQNWISSYSFIFVLLFLFISNLSSYFFVSFDSIFTFHNSHFELICFLINYFLFVYSSIIFYGENYISITMSLKNSICSTVFIYLSLYINKLYYIQFVKVSCAFIWSFLTQSSNFIHIIFIHIYHS